MKNTILLLFLFFTIISCKAQNYPLNTDYETIPNNSHIKDMNNVLEKYAGTWKSTIGNKEVYLYITKQNDRQIKLLSNELLFLAPDEINLLTGTLNL